MVLKEGGDCLLSFSLSEYDRNYGTEICSEAGGIRETGSWCE